jgi:hypothetical protein
VVALQLVAVVVAQKGDFLLGLDALGDDPEVELLAERDDRRGDRAVVLVGGKILDERAVDLQPLDRKPLQRAEARIAGAEIVDRRLIAAALSFGAHSDPPWGEANFAAARRMPVKALEP